MVRLIVNAEAVYGQFRESPNPQNLSPVIAVSVSGENGRAKKSLQNNAFRICAIVPPAQAPKFKNLSVFSVDEQKSGLYVLSLVFPKVPAPSGKYIFSVTVTDSGNRGQTLTTFEI